VCQSDDGMETTPLDSVLVDILSSPVPPPDYRGALRSILPVEDATKVLEIYAKWMTAYVNSQGQALAGWADDKSKKKKPDHLKHLPTLEAVSCIRLTALTVAHRARDESARLASPAVPGPPAIVRPLADAAGLAEPVVGTARLISPFTSPRRGGPYVVAQRGEEAGRTRGQEECGQAQRCRTGQERQAGHGGADAR